MSNPVTGEPSLKDLLEQARSGEVRLHLRPVGLPGEPFPRPPTTDVRSQRT